MGTHLQTQKRQVSLARIGWVLFCLGCFALGVYLSGCAMGPTYETDKVRVDCSEGPCFNRERMIEFVDLHLEGVDISGKINVHILGAELFDCTAALSYADYSQASALEVVPLEVSFAYQPGHETPMRLCYGLTYIYQYKPIKATIIVAARPCLNGSALGHEFAHLYSAYTYRDSDGGHLRDDVWNRVEKINTAFGCNVEERTQTP